VSGTVTGNQGTAAAVTAPWPVYGGSPASVTMQNAAVANGNGSTLTVTGYQTALVNVNCSVACSGGTTINFEGADSTGTYFSIAAIPVGGSSGGVTSATTSGQFWVPVSGLTTIRARISAYSAGTITVTGTAVFGVNAGLSQTANGATSANQTSGGQKTQIVDGSGNVIASTNNAINNFTQAPTVTFGSLVKGTTAAMTGTTSTQVLAAVASQHLYVMSVHCTNSSATATLVQLQDGSGGTVLDTIICPAGGGDERNASMPMFWTTAGNGLFAADVTTGASVIVQASGYSSAN
jgi:hypothetical protein